MMSGFANLAEPMRFNWIGKTIEAAAAGGLDVRPRLAHAGVLSAASPDAEAPIGPAEFLVMCAILINAADDEMHGAAKSRMARGTANLVVKSIGAVGTLQSAVETMIRFFAIAGVYCRLHLATGNGSARIMIRSSVPNPAVRPVVEEMFAGFLHIQLSHYLGFLLPVSRFQTTAPDHPFLGRAHPYVLGTVSLADTTALEFPEAYLGFNSRIEVGTNPLLDGELAWISRHAELRSGKFPGADHDTLSGAVYRRLLNGDLTFEQCCGLMRRAPGAVRRGLLLEGQSFRRLRRAALMERSRPMLQQGVSVDDLAYSLGYSDGRSLRRALKAATGFSIAELRNLALPGRTQVSPGLLNRLVAEKAHQL